MRRREGWTGCEETQDVRPCPLEVCVEVPSEVAWREVEEEERGQGRRQCGG